MLDLPVSLHSILRGLVLGSDARQTKALKVFNFQGFYFFKDQGLLQKYLFFQGTSGKH